ncbi:MAG: GTPase, partial [Myxococcota bacterium]
MTESEPHRTGVLALLGPPNAGKSTLLNRLLGEKLAIVSAKPQTTRSDILGILTLPRAQILIHDTPGRHDSTRALNRALNDVVDAAAADCDLALVL